MTDTLLIEEIITKECERYELDKNGFVTDRWAVVKELSSGDCPLPLSDASPEGFAEWKEQLLNDWYVRNEFAKFFHRKAQKGCMLRLVKRLLLNMLSRLRKNHTAMTVDDELRIEEGRTVAFKLSSDCFSVLYREICSGKQLFISPGQLEETCIARISSFYPLDYPFLYERLTAKDDEFWKEIWLLIQRFIRFLVIEGRAKEDSEAIKEVSMETALSVQEQLKRGSLSRIESAAHLLNSVQATGRNKFREWLRAEEKQRRETLLDEEDWLDLEKECVSVSHSYKVDGRFAYLLEVNEKSEYDVCCALVDVLNFGCGQVYRDLTEGMEDSVRVMLMLYVEDKKYEEIATALYGTFSERQLTSLRKSVSRGKEYLKKRMKGLIVTYKYKGEVPFVAEEE